MSTRPLGMPLAGSHLCKARHVCAFFHSADDQYSVTLPYISDGLAAGDKAIHIVNPSLRGEHVHRMESFGIDTAQARDTGQLELHDWSDTFFSEGDFDADRMLAQLATVLAASREQGHLLTRFVAHAEWALDPRAGLDKLIEFEARVNLMWPEESDAVICAYDLARFSGDTVIEVLRTHPMMIVGGILQENPFYVQPQEFLENLPYPEHDKDPKVSDEERDAASNDLKELLNDLLGVVSLSAVWRGGDPPRIVQSLVGMLASVLRPDHVYVRLEAPEHETPVQISWSRHPSSDRLDQLLEAQLGIDPRNWARSARVAFKGLEMSSVAIPIGLQGDGHVVVVSQRPTFPTSSERLLLSVIANQAATGLQQARILSAQRGVAQELDQRMAVRTRELATANTEMRKEMARRIRMERRLKREEEDLQQSRTLLVQAQRLEALGNLAGGIAHDFNNLLGSILGFGERALREAPSGGRLRHDIESIVAAGERARVLVEKVLLFSRTSRIERAAVHIEAVVREALDLLSANIPDTVIVETNLRAGRAMVDGDSTQIHQLVMNLATNAIQAMPEGGKLTVSLRQIYNNVERPMKISSLAAGEHVALEVVDTGAGIAAEYLDRIFDPFFTTKMSSIGTGLGLSLVHRIVTDAGGAINVKTQVGVGSTFTVYLRRSKGMPDHGDRSDAAIPRGIGQRVLIVDDELPLLELMADVLTDLGYMPVKASSSQAALDILKAGPETFDVVVTDLRMPGLSGDALVREVRRHSPRVPLILMTGNPDNAMSVCMDDCQVDAVLTKPVRAGMLAASLARVLGMAA